MNHPLRVAVIQGGPSSEASVSRSSALAIADALSRAGHHAQRVELDSRLWSTLSDGSFDVAFPICHGAFGEDGCLQGCLEILGIPYVGSDVLASSLAMDKAMAKRIFAASGLPIARGRAVPRGDALRAASDVRQNVGARLVVKPSRHGSAIGVSRFEADATEEQVAQGLLAVWEVDDVAIVEHFAKGREVTCGVFEGDDGPVALPPTEIFAPSDAFYTFQARYAPGRSVHQCPAALDPKVFERVKEVAVLAHKALGCRDLSRADFIVGDVADERAIVLLEVNTLPGFTATSLYPEAAAVRGMPMERLCSLLVERAHKRGPRRRVESLALPQ